VVISAANNDGASDAGAPPLADGKSGESSYRFNRSSRFWQNPTARDWVWPQLNDADPKGPNFHEA